MAKKRDAEYDERRKSPIASSKKEARELGAWRYYGEPCEQGHVPTIRFTANSVCQDCRTAPERPAEDGYIAGRGEQIAASKKEALRLELRRYYGGKPCSRGHFPPVRFVANGNCHDCGLWHGKQRVLKMQEAGTWESELARIRMDRKSTPEKHERVNQLGRDWYRRFPGKALANSMDRKIRKRRSTVPWADKKALTTIYKTCRELSRETGLIHHVDHIVPLNGKFINGLHVQSNLRIILKLQNIQKSNKFDLGNLADAIDWTAEYYTKGWIPVAV